MGPRVRLLHPYQVWDLDRGCFFVGLKMTPERYQGHRVYTDAFGAKFAIVGADG